MQIDLHHGVTYLLSRIAGFTAEEANIIAYSSAYVDDATNSGLIEFDNGAMYFRISSAHRMADLRNLNAHKNLQVWTPFHFLPGNGGLEAGKNPSSRFIDKLVCTPNSFVAKDMVKYCIDEANKPFGLHRLGITLHVLADTFSHQGFAGVNNKINEVHKLKSTNPIAEKSSWQKLINKASNVFVKNVLPLGHGSALSFPDLPYDNWEFVNGFGDKKQRNNKEVFINATKMMFEAISEFRSARDKKKYNTSIPEKDIEIIEHNINSFIDEDGDKRHKKWIHSILNDHFSFKKEENETITYIPKGLGSWKYLALKTEKTHDKENEKFTYNKDFLDSNWKHFHDALQKHRLEVQHEILPKYGICC